MPKRRRSEDDMKTKRKRGAKAGSQSAAEMEDEKSSDDHMRQLQEVQELELEKHELHDQVSHLQSKMARLKQEAAEARATAKQSTAVAAAASMDLINCQLIVNQLRQENATLVGEVEKVAKLTEKCDILKYERDGLRGRLRAASAGIGNMGEEKVTSSDSTKILEEKAEWYKKNFLAEQKKVKKEREKSKTVQAELNNRIAALVTQITRAESEKKSAIALLMKTKADCEKLTGKISVELKNSLDAREKLNHSLDESDGARKELQSKVDRYHHEVTNATEYVLNLKKEHGQMNESMIAERNRAEKLFQALQIAEQHITELVMGKQAKQEFRTSAPSSFASPNDQFFRTPAPQANASRQPLLPFQQYTNAIRPPPLLPPPPGYMNNVLSVPPRQPNQYNHPPSNIY